MKPGRLKNAKQWVLDNVPAPNDGQSKFSISRYEVARGPMLAITDPDVVKIVMSGPTLEDLR